MSGGALSLGVGVACLAGDPTCSDLRCGQCRAVVSAAILAPAFRAARIGRPQIEAFLPVFFEALWSVLKSRQEVLRDLAAKSAAPGSPHPAPAVSPSTSTVAVPPLPDGVAASPVSDGVANGVDAFNARASGASPSEGARPERIAGRYGGAPTAVARTPKRRVRPPTTPRSPSGVVPRVGNGSGNGNGGEADEAPVRSPSDPRSDRERSR